MLTLAKLLIHMIVTEQCSIIGCEMDKLHFIPVQRLCIFSPHNVYFHLTFDVAIFVLAVLVCGHFGLSLLPFWSDLWLFCRGRFGCNSFLCFLSMHTVTANMSVLRGNFKNMRTV